jgi:hypothetical protein
MNRSLLRALVGAVAGAPILIACQAPIALATEDFCGETGNHCIVVTVDPVKNAIAVDSDELHKRGPGKIRWRIENDSTQNQNFIFPADGIAFSASDGGTTVFDDCHIVKSDAHLFVCRDSTGKPGRYKYTVKVTVPNGSNNLPPPYDPIIVNN